MEHWLKKYVAGVVLVLIAIAAYLQASGVSSLLGAALGGIETGAPLRSVAEATVWPLDDHVTSARPILDRNPFDSVTRRPLDITSVDGLAGFDVADRAPPCEGLKAILVLAAPDPAWSMVALQGATPQTCLARIGQDVGGRIVRTIEWNRAVLSAGSSLCQVRMFRVGKPALPSSSSTPLKDNAPAAGSVPPEIASRIERIGANELNVDRQAMDSILENQTELLRHIRIVPEQANGKVAGIRLFGIQRGTLLDLLGLENGDRLQAINGFELSDPERALEAYAKLRMADHLTAQINRRGQNLNIDYWIK